MVCVVPVAGGVVTMNKAGTFPYYSSRNNNFSNRDQTGRICVAPNVATCAGLAAGVVGSKSAAMPLVPDAAVVVPLQDATFAFNEKDNDATGDGDLTGCGFNYFLSNLNEASAVGLFIGMIILGAGVVLITQFGLRTYLGKARGINDICCGSEASTVKGGKKGPKYSANISSTPIGNSATPSAPPVQEVGATLVTHAWSSCRVLSSNPRHALV